MKLENLHRIFTLAKQKKEIDALVRELNEIDSGDPFCCSIPPDVLKYVDAKLAAKGLMSLLLETSHKVDEELTSLGVDL